MGSRLRSEKNRLYKFFYKLVTSSSFNCFIFGLILVNTVVLALDDYP
jgi:hypothetical protein